MDANFHKADTAKFLQPLHMDTGVAIALSRELYKTFQHLASDSTDQFLPTPIAESILRPEAGQEKGRYVDESRIPNHLSPIFTSDTHPLLHPIRTRE